MTRCGQPLFVANVPASFPSPADDYKEEKLDLNKYLIRNPAATYFVRVTGDSMIGAGQGGMWYRIIISAFIPKCRVELDLTLEIIKSIRLHGPERNIAGESHISGLYAKLWSWQVVIFANIVDLTVILAYLTGFVQDFLLFKA